MVLKRKRGDEWVEVTKPSARTKGSSSNVALPSSHPTKASDAPSSSQRRDMGHTSHALAAKPAPIEIPTTPPAKKPRTVASQHPMLASFKSQPEDLSPTGKSSINAYASTSTAPLPAIHTASQSSSQAKKPTRRRNKANTAGETGEAAAPPEKRLARFKPSCPNNIAERLARVREQIFYLLDRTGRPENTSPTSPSLKEDFKVSGSTGNVYTVTIDKLPRCSCPDSQKGNHCKHILFVFTKVLQVSRDSGLWYQKALLSTELSSIFTNAPLAPNAPTNPRMQAEYDKAIGKAAGPSTSSQTRKRMPQEGDDCPVCYDTMHGAGEAGLVWCEGCGNALHKGCFTQWSNTARANGNAVTCVWCRTKWISSSDAGSSGGVRRTTSGYLNLGGVGGVSPVRDTSSYYHGPRRGQRYYGSQYYGDD